MFIERVISFNNGWPILLEQKSSEWHEIVSALKKADSDVSTSRSASLEHAMYALQFQDALQESNWSEVPSTTIHLNFAKNKVFASVLNAEGVTGSSFANEFYLNTPHRFQVGLIDVSVLLAPTNEAITHFIKLSGAPSRAATLPTEDFCRAEMVKFGLLTSQAPVVLAFFSPAAPEKITVEEIIPLKVSAPVIERIIEFAPEYYQAGVGLLSYFGEVLRQKAPATKAKVRIEQDGRLVRLHIESPSGDIETVEKELDQYALVISNQAPPESLFESKAHIMQLETRLEMARLELKQAHDLKQLTNGVHAQQVRSMQQQIDSLVQQVATQLLQQNKVFDLMQQQASSNERMQLALLTHGQMLFKDLLVESSGNQRLVDAIESLRHNLMSGMALIDIEDKLEQALSTIKQTKPGLLPRMLSELEGATYKAAAGGAVGAAVTWLTQHIH